MTPPYTDPEPGLVSRLPATLEGLWTAITMSHEVARQLVDWPGSEVRDASEGVVAACAQAAESLAASRPEALHPTTDLPLPRDLDPVEGLPLVSSLTSECIDLAVEVLGNEDEPLTPVEVLAVTRAVTALCTARSLAQGWVA